MMRIIRRGAVVLALLSYISCDCHALVSYSLLSRQRSAVSCSGAAGWGPSLHMTSLDGNDPSKRRLRKRDRLRNAWGSARLLVPSRGLPTRVRMNTNDPEEKDEEEESSKGLSKFLQLDKVTQAVRAKIPDKVLAFIDAFIEKVKEWIPGVRIGLVSFVAGVILATGAILIPVYQQVDGLSEPVTLFETILGDLDRGYVDEVDTQKLFETGVSAMLRSLDPYTEFEGRQEAQDMSESIEGKYGGVGLVISGATPKDLAFLKEKNAAEATPVSSSSTVVPSTLLPADAIQDSISGETDVTNAVPTAEKPDDEDFEEELSPSRSTKKDIEAVQQRGITVVSAFEGYAFDYGMRVGDKLVAIDGERLGGSITVEDVRNKLRGEPGSVVEVSFERVGVDGVQTVAIPRTVVRIRDVKLATLVGNPKDGIGYIQLTGFASDAGREMRSAIKFLQQRAEDATDGESSLKGLILDLRGNPGGLLTSAVDVASTLVPKGSDIVSAKGRGFPGILYRSRSEPLLDTSKTKLAVLVNGGTASAAEIVSGAIQDLDTGIIVGSDRTFGKGLVQNVEDLPFDTALKFTVAKYYTPSGRCIQGVDYTEGGGLNPDEGRYTAKKVSDKDRMTFYTKAGREVKDGGGIEADYKVAAPKASALEVTLLRSGVISDFAAQWSKGHELSNNFEIDEETYRDFQAFVQEKQKTGDIKLDALYTSPLNDLKRILKQSGYKGSSKELENLKNGIVRDLLKDFDKYRKDIKEDIAQGILARYLPESMLIERSIKTDQQVLAAAKLLSNEQKFDKLLAKGSAAEDILSSHSTGPATSSISTATTAVSSGTVGGDGAKVKLGKW